MPLHNNKSTYIFTMKSYVHKNIHKFECLEYYYYCKQPFRFLWHIQKHANWNIPTHVYVNPHYYIIHFAQSFLIHANSFNHTCIYIHIQIHIHMYATAVHMHTCTHTLTATARDALSAMPTLSASWNIRFRVLVTSWCDIASTYSRRSVLLRYIMYQNSIQMFLCCFLSPCLVWCETWPDLCSLLFFDIC